MVEVEIKLVDNWNKNEIVNLYKSGGWWKNSYDKSEINSLIKGSFIFAVVVHKKTKKAIGMGRVISDGVSDGYIQDLIILEKYRNQGLGTKLVKSLIDYCISKDINWIALISEPDQDEFYKKNNFRVMKKYVPMKFSRKD